MKILRRLLLLALFVGAIYVVLTFSEANATPVAIDLLLLELAEVALWVALLAAFAVGAAVALLIVAFELAKKSLINRRFRKQIEVLEAEVHQLRTLPLAEGAGGLATPPAIPATTDEGDPEAEDSPKAVEGA